jgi:p-aminobenzoyl-glutamate transporter AbgT
MLMYLFLILKGEMCSELAFVSVTENDYLFWIFCIYLLFFSSVTMYKKFSISRPQNDSRLSVIDLRKYDEIQ